MNKYRIDPQQIIDYKGTKISSFISAEATNIDHKTVESFGKEWEKFSSFTEKELAAIGDTYFDLLNGKNSSNFTALDLGCGTGRWSRYLSDRVKFIEAVDPSNAALVASDYLKEKKNVRVSIADVSIIPFQDESFDLVFSLGVLHHIPDTLQAMKDCVKKVKKGGYFLVYLYYDFSDRGLLFKAVFKFSSFIRFIVSKLPFFIKSLVCDLLAIFCYLPFVFFAKILRFFSFGNEMYLKIPLSYYIDKSFKVIRNDSLDRFGTPLEQRFSKEEINDMMIKSGLTDIEFSSIKPYWHAIGKKE